MILRDALHRHLAVLSSEHDAEAWAQAPLTESERLLSEIADWGPAEDWADWIGSVHPNTARARIGARAHT